MGHPAICVVSACSSFFLSSFGRPSMEYGRGKWMDYIISLSHHVNLSVSRHLYLVFQSRILVELFGARPSEESGDEVVVDGRGLECE